MYMEECMSLCIIQINFMHLILILILGLWWKQLILLQLLILIDVVYMEMRWLLGWDILSMTLVRIYILLIWTLSLGRLFFVQKKVKRNILNLELKLVSVFKTTKFLYMEARTHMTYSMIFGLLTWYHANILKLTSKTMKEDMVIQLLLTITNCISLEELEELLMREMI